ARSAHVRRCGGVSGRAATWGRPYAERYAIARGAVRSPVRTCTGLASALECLVGWRRSPYHAAPFRLVEGLGMGSRQYNVAVVGATGIVGAEFLKIVAERRFPLKGLKLLATERSAGRRIAFGEGEIEVEATTPASFAGSDFVFI